MYVNGQPHMLSHVHNFFVLNYDKMASDMEVRMKQRCIIEFLHAEKIAPYDIHGRLLNVYGDQTVDVSTVRRWVACFSSGDSDMKDKTRSGQIGRAHV